MPDRAPRPPAAAVVQLDPGRQLMLGREPGADIALIWDPRVSRLHAVLERVDDWWTLSDVSTNGTYRNDERVLTPCRLRDGDVLQLGATLLVFRDPARAAADDTARTDDLATPA